uniref:Uncharacterized protein n=1 Tax=Leptobrachium leishanense TaxID=445787 RepID=A0A8C5PJG8_9ANUR
MKKTLNQVLEKAFLYDQGRHEFDEIAIYFTEDEWDCLTEAEKELYVEVMMENYQTLRSLGLIYVIPPVVSLIERGEEPYVNHQRWLVTESPGGDITLGKDPRTTTGERCHTPASSPESMDNEKDTKMKSETVDPSCTRTNESTGNEELTDSQNPDKHMSVPIALEMETWEEDEPLDVQTPTEHTQTGFSTLGVTDSSPSHETRDTDTCTPAENTEIEYTTVRIKEEEDEDDFSYIGVDGSETSNYKTAGNRSSSKGAVMKDNGQIRMNLIRITDSTEYNKRFNTGSTNHNHSKTGSERKFVKHWVVHDDDNKPFTCKECGKSFPRSLELQKHLQTHTGERPFSCPECGKGFMDKSNLVKHRRFHTGENLHSCLECGKVFICASYLEKHQKVHTGEKPYSCPKCSKSFTFKANMLKHELIHTGEKPFSCSKCGKRFTYKSDLVKHEMIHTGEKSFPCPECGKYFLNKSRLKVHQKTHIGEKSHTCNVCGKGFSCSSYLITHQRTHTGEKPFSCTECGKRFIDKSGLVKHQHVHSGDKPFSCPDCGKSFPYKSRLASHQKTHVGGKR